MDTKHDQEIKPAPIQVSVWLTPSELESLRRNLKDANAYFKKAFAGQQAKSEDTVSGKDESAQAPT